MRYFLTTTTALFLSAFAHAGDVSTSLRDSFAPYIASEENVGLVISQIRDGVTTTATLGSTKLGVSSAPRLDTVFQIGSASKTFTSLVLAELVLENRVRLDDPIAKFFPDVAELQTGSVGAITLGQLSTHTSGLPRIPANMDLSNVRDPYADYTPALLIAALKDPKLLSHVGPYPISYSNMGAGLLGYILTRVTGLSYDAMIRERITKPLGMVDTGVARSLSQALRSAHGYDETLSVAPFWNFTDSLVGAGGIHSTITDMTKYVRANLDPPASPIGRAITFSHALEAHGSAASVGLPPTADIGLAWIRSIYKGDEIVWHNGEVGGFFSFSGINLTRHTAVELISNTASSDVQNCALLRLVEQECPAPAKDFPVSEGALSAYAGKYVLTADATQTIVIGKTAHFLTADFDGQAKVRMHTTDGEHFTFELNSNPDSIVFQTDVHDRANSLVITDRGADYSATRAYP